MSGSINHINGYKFGAGTSYLSSTNTNPPPSITWNNGKYDFSLTTGIGSDPTYTINFTGEQGTGSIISPELTEYDQLRSDGPLNASVDVVTFENGEFSIAWSVQGGSPLGFDYTVGYVDFYSPLGTKLGTTLRPFGDGQHRSPGEMKFEGSTVDDLKVRYIEDGGWNVVYDISSNLPEFLSRSESIIDNDTSPNIIFENSSIGESVGIEVNSMDAVSYSLIDNAEGLFQIDSSTGQVTTAKEVIVDHNDSNTFNYSSFGNSDGINNC